MKKLLPCPRQGYKGRDVLRINPDFYGLFTLYHFYFVYLFPVKDQIKKLKVTPSVKPNKIFKERYIALIIIDSMCDEDLLLYISVIFAPIHVL